jgi:hypothetical protein
VLNVVSGIPVKPPRIFLIKLWDPNHPDAKSTGIEMKYGANLRSVNA